MTKEQFLYVDKVYKDVVRTGLLIPDKLRTAANYILGKDKDELIAVNKARQVIYSWYNYHRKQAIEQLDILFTVVDEDDDNTIHYIGTKVDKTETSTPDESESLSIDNEGQSHTEEDNKPKLSKEEEIRLVKQINDMQLLWQECEDANERRSIKMKIRHIKSKHGL